MTRLASEFPEAPRADTAPRRASEFAEMLFGFLVDGGNCRLGTQRVVACVVLLLSSSSSTEGPRTEASGAAEAVSEEEGW